MAKLILKVNYYKPGRSKSMGGYAKYIATRENVEKNEDKVLHLKSTENQQERNCGEIFPKAFTAKNIRHTVPMEQERMPVSISRGLWKTISRRLSTHRPMPTILQPVRELNASVLTGCFLPGMNRLSFPRCPKN